MLDTRPNEPEWLSWIYVCVGALVIFVTVPFARAVQELVSESVGRQFFLYVVVAAAVVAVGLASRTIFARRVSPKGYMWLSLVAIAFASYAFSLRRNPEEAVHFLEYGILGLLVYRALVHRIRDQGIYLIAVVVTGIIGLVDEWLQWIAPSRYWDIRDLWINVFAGAMMQLAIALGLRPLLVSGRPTAQSWRKLCRASAAGLFLLGLSFANTPERIQAYASNLPALSFLLNNKSMMVEYGYLYQDSEIGLFRSRFTLDELDALDRQHGTELARVLDEYINDDLYGKFLEMYSVPRDAYFHEAGVHLFRRNRYLEIARTEEVRRAKHYNIALRENRILEKYYPTGLEGSEHAWNDAVHWEVNERADKNVAYESSVSAGLITRIGEREILTIFAVSVAGLLLLSAPWQAR